MRSGLVVTLAVAATVSCTTGNYRPQSDAPFQALDPPGVVVMAPEPSRTAERQLWVAQAEVTQAQFEALMGFNPSRYSRCPDCPVESVSWYDAALYANALSDAHGFEACYDLQQCTSLRGVEAEPGAGRLDMRGPRGTTCTEAHSNIDTCTGYRLPTAAEWAWLAPAEGADTSVREARRYAHLLPNRVAEPWPVASLEANSLGLYDTIGNVDEWLHDETATPTRVRGPRREDADGRWCNTAGLCFGSRWQPEELYQREAELAHWGRYCLGFRVVRQLQGEPAGEGSTEQ